MSDNIENVESCDDASVDTNDENLTKKEYDITNLKDIFEIFDKEEPDKIIKNSLIKYLNDLQAKYKFTNYKIVFLFDEHSSISSYETDKIYEKVKGVKNTKDILLILNSTGGSGEPSYLLSKALKRLSKNKFVISIPRRAKSAATLIALGADEIHMGLMSELGPIDLQVGGYPALGLGNSLEYIAKVVSKYPKSHEMFAKYLTEKMDLIHLGYLERLGESTVQYGERLIGEKCLPENRSAADVAKLLVYEYKDHSFVIDIDEAKGLLGEDIIKENTKEYDFANEIYSVLDIISKVYDYFEEKYFSYVGDSESGFNLRDKPKTK